MNPFLPSLHILSTDSYLLNLNTYDRLWLYGGLFTLVAYFFVALYESHNKPSEVQISLQNIYLSPAEIGYFLKGTAHPGHLLAATLLDLIRRNHLSFKDDAFILSHTDAPKSRHEKYLIDWLNSFSKKDLIRLGAIKGYRLNSSEDYFKDLQIWFDMLDSSLIDHGLKYRMRANRGNSTLYLCVGIFLLIVGLIGLSQKYYFALIPILTGFLFLGIAIRIYGALPPEGQSVHRYIYPLMTLPKNKIYSNFSKLNEDTLFLYSLAINRNLIDQSRDTKVTDLYRELSSKEPWEDMIQNYFIGSHIMF